MKIEENVTVHEEASSFLISIRMKCTLFICNAPSGELERGEDAGGVCSCPSKGPDLILPGHLSLEFCLLSFAVAIALCLIVSQTSPRCNVYIVRGVEAKRHARRECGPSGQGGSRPLSRFFLLHVLKF